MSDVSPYALAAFLGQQRWFGTRGATCRVTEVEVLATLREQPLVELWLVHVADDAGTDAYHLVVERRNRAASHLRHVAIDSGPGWAAYDGLHDRAVTGDWPRLLDGSIEVAGLTAHRVGAHPVPEVGPSLVLTAEQSNTSLVYGGSLIVKFFRRPQPGLHPDVEVQTALAGVGCPHVAKAYGWIDGRAGTLAFAQEFLRDGVEGWDLAKSSVRDLVREGDLHADEVGGDFAAEAERLGEVTAEVHESLRAALPTATWGGPDLARRAARMHAHLASACEEAPQLQAYATALAAAYDELALLGGSLPVQRVHGDLHLGQAMRVTTGWKLLDFEGEPARSVEDRRALDSPMRDVAGMLRSFDYAAHQSDADAESAAQVSYRAAEWASRNRAAFCEGYARITGHDPREDATLLRAYEADKAVYEVVYEARMRPDWLPLPLAAIERLAG